MSPNRYTARSARHRDEGLSRLRRLTVGAGLTGALGVAAATGYVAHVAPGHHLSSGAAATAPASSSGVSAAAPSPYTAAGLAPPVALGPPVSPPASSGYAPQVVSGSS